MENKMGKKINGEIELLRFIFAIGVVLVHSTHLFGDEWKYFHKAGFGVEFFFLVTGFLLAKSISKVNKERHYENLVKETLLFIRKKVSAFYLELILAATFGLIFILFTSILPKKEIFLIFCQSIPHDCLLLFATGFWKKNINGPVWYLSTMLLCIMLYYPILRTAPEWLKKIGIPVFSMCLLGWMVKTYGTILGPGVWTGFTFRGNIRGFAEIGIGVTIYYIVQELQNINFSRISKIILMIFKWIGLVVIIRWILVGSTNKFLPLYVIILIASLIIVFSQQAFDNGIYHNQGCYFLGKISMPLYLCHYYFCSSKPELASLNNILPADMEPWMKIAILMAVSITTAIIIKILADWIRKSGILMRIKAVFIMEK